MFSPELDAIVPMLCVTLAALASMGAEAFRGKNERLPIGGLGIVGLAGAAVSSVLLWNRSTSGFGVIQADNFGLFVTLTLVVIGVIEFNRRAGGVIHIKNVIVDPNHLGQGVSQALIEASSISTATRP